VCGASGGEEGGVECRAVSGACGGRLGEGQLGEVVGPPHVQHFLRECNGVVVAARQLLHVHQAGQAIGIELLLDRTTHLDADALAVEDGMVEGYGEAHSALIRQD